MAVAAAEEKMAATRVKCKNACEMAARSLGDPGSQRRGRIIIEVGTPLYSAFSKELAGASKPETSRKFHVAYSRFAYSFVFRQIWGKLTDNAALARMMFSFEPTDGGSYRKILGLST